MNKYDGLPDIDGSMQDVFETSDIDDISDVDQPQPNNEDIDCTPIDTSAATLKFKTFKTDFLGSITSSLSSSGYTATESLTDKLARISRELKEINLSEANQTQINTVNTLQASVNDIKYNDYAQRLDSLFHDIVPEEKERETKNERVSEKERETVVSPTSDSGILKQTHTDGQNSATKPVNRGSQSVAGGRESISSSPLLQLESKITKLEQAIGIDHYEKSIPNVLNDLARKINIIHNPEFNIAKINSQINQMNTQYETLLSKSKLFDLEPQPIVAQDTKINEIYANLDKLAAVNKTVPLILRRLKSLNTVHHDMANSVTTVGELDQVLDDIKLDFQKWHDSIKTVQDNLQVYEANTTANRESISAQLEELHQRLHGLGGGK